MSRLEVLPLAVLCGGETGALSIPSGVEVRKEMQLREELGQGCDCQHRSTTLPSCQLDTYAGVLGPN